MAAALRAFVICVAIVAFFLVFVPLQKLVARRAPRAASHIPIVFCRSLLGLAKVSVSVHGERVCSSPAIIAPNHVSWIDILALGGQLPFCFLAKSEVATWPIVSAFATVQGTVFVDRKRRRSIPAANRALAERLLEGRSVLIFAEGTTNGPPLPGRFHSSHFAAARDLLATATHHDDVLVQPVAISYSSDLAAWIGDDDLLSHLWRTLRSPPIRCVLRFGEPMVYSRGSDRKVIATRLRDAICAMLAARPADRAVPAAASGPGRGLDDIGRGPGFR